MAEKHCNAVAQNSPEPWLWEKSRNGLTYIYDRNGRVIARVYRPDGMSVEEQQANARVIAKAALGVDGKDTHTSPPPATDGGEA